MGGTLAPDAPSYVERQADQEIFQHLSQGEFCHVLTSRQMGKSSLMVRTANRLRAAGHSVAVADLTLIGRDVTPEQWYLGLLDCVRASLQLDLKPERLWSEQPSLGPWQRFARVLHGLLLSHTRRRLVVFIDEVDFVRSLPFSTDEFFAGIRALHNLRAEDPTYERIAFCLLGVATPTDLIRDPRATPFNVGRRIELRPFSREEVRRLLVGLAPTQTNLEEKSARPPFRSGADAAPGSASTIANRQSPIADSHLPIADSQPPINRSLLTPAATEALLDRIVYWTGGQPYLTQRLCASVAADRQVTSPRGVDRVCADLFLEPRARERDDNLLFVRKQLQANPARLPAVLSLYGRVLKGREVPDTDTDPITATLRLSGLVLPENSRLAVANRIYRTVFDAAWVKRMMPQDELQRQRAAFWKGWIRSAAIFSALLAGVVLLVLSIAGLNRKLKLAVADFQVRRAVEFIEVNDVSSGLAYLADALRDSRENGAAYLRAVSALNQRGFALPTGVAFPHTNRILFAAYNPAGDLVATASRDRSARIWDAATGAPRTPWLRHGGEVTHVEFDQTGTRLLTVCTNQANEVAVWDATTGAKQFALSLTQAVSVAAFSPDGSRIVTAWSRGLRVWAAEKGDPITEPFALSNVVQLVRFSPDGTKLVTTSNDKEATIWNARNGRAIHILRHPSDVTAARFDPKGQKVLTGCADGGARLYSVESGALLHELFPQPHPGELDSADVPPDVPGPRIASTLEKPGLVEAQFDPTGKLFAIASKDSTAQIWDAGQLKPLFLLPHEEQVVVMEFSSDGLLLLTVALDEVVRVWDCLSGRLLVQPFKFYTFIGSVTFHPTRRQLLIASGDVTGPNYDQLAVNHTAQIWDLRVTAGFGLPILHAAAVTDVAFTADGMRVASAGADGVVLVSDRQNGATLKSLTHLDQPVSRLTFSESGDQLLTVCSSNKVEICDTQNWRTQASQLYPGTNAVLAVLSRTEDRVASASSNVVTIWNAADGRIEFEQKLPETTVTALALSPDGQWLLAGTADEMVHRWHRPNVSDWTAWTTLDPIRFTNSVVQHAEFSLHSRRVLTAHRDEVARVWQADTGESATAGALLKMDRPVKYAEFSPDGAKVLTIGGRKVRIWDAATAEALTETFQHEAEINSAHFSPDGNLVLTASEDGTARLWDVRTGLEIADPLRHDGPVVQARFSPDGRWLLTASSDKTARVWQAPFTSGLASVLPGLLEAVAGRSVTKQQIFAPVHRTNLLAFQGNNAPALADGGATQWLAWFFADPATRSISPGSKFTVPEYVNRLISLDTPASLAEALRLQPNHPRANSRWPGRTAAPPE